jgi:hypothetical protein
LHGNLAFAALAFVLSLAAGIRAQNGAANSNRADGSPAAPQAPALDLAQIVAGIEHHDAEQARALKQYKDVRHYTINYHGFGRNVNAAVEAEVDYDAASGKSYKILSESGSKALCHRVIERALESEKEAAQDKSSTALNSSNYRFKLLGSEAIDGRAAYILSVDPIKPSKFLYKGKIWVDASDFAVVKMDVQPAKNPSFWISETLIRHSNKKTNGFWLPQRNESTTKVRIGGTAVMTIDYGSYETVPQAAPEALTASSARR